MTERDDLANGTLHEITSRTESFYAKVNYDTPEGPQWVRGWTVPSTFPGTDIPTLDVFWIRKDDTLCRNIVRAEDVYDIEVTVNKDE